MASRLGRNRVVYMAYLAWVALSNTVLFVLLVRIPGIGGLGSSIPCFGKHDEVFLVFGD